MIPRQAVVIPRQAVVIPRQAVVIPRQAVVIPRQAVVEVGRALLTICPATLVEEKKTARKAPASSQGSFLLLYYPIFGFFCLVILFLCLSNVTNTVFVEFLTNKHF